MVAAGGQLGDVGDTFDQFLSERSTRPLIQTLVLKTKAAVLLAGHLCASLIDLLIYTCESCVCVCVCIYMPAVGVGHPGWTPVTALRTASITICNFHLQKDGK